MPLVQERAGALFERVALDLVGPMPPSRRGKVYLLVMQDCFTKWIEVVAIPNKTARVVAAAFADTWVTRYGSPRLLHQDNGSEFTTKVFVELCKLLGITRTMATPYYPQSNGQVERANQTIQALMKCVCNDTGRDWADVCNWVAAAFSSGKYRTNAQPNGFREGKQHAVGHYVWCTRPRTDVCYCLCGVATRKSRLCA
jgi:transposase InsO family protein